MLGPLPCGPAHLGQQVSWGVSSLAALGLLQHAQGQVLEVAAVSYSCVDLSFWPLQQPLLPAGIQSHVRRKFLMDEASATQPVLMC